MDVDQVFDAISYLKGSSAIRMLATHLGQETFLKGVGIYLKRHAYGNAKTSDLWSALSQASGQDVNALMDPWIRKIGFPVLTVGEEPGQIGIKQSRYLSTGDVKPEEDQPLIKLTRWQGGHARSVGVKHLCGARCAGTLMDRWMTQQHADPDAHCETN